MQGGTPSAGSAVLVMDDRDMRALECSPEHCEHSDLAVWVQCQRSRRSWRPAQEFMPTLEASTRRYTYLPRQQRAEQALVGHVILAYISVGPWLAAPEGRPRRSTAAAPEP